MTSRIEPAERPYTPAIEKALARLMPPGMEPLLLFRVLARNARVCERFMAGGLLDKGSITMRQREIVILRTTARCGSEYEWGVHTAAFAAHVKLDEAAQAATVHGSAEDPVWADEERVLIRLVDRLHETAQVDDALWADLKAHYTDEQIIELVILTGFYHTVSFATNAFRLETEPGAPAFPPR